jgi:peptidoglycan/LPS O-acetylase OafA/YrhL
LSPNVTSVKYGLDKQINIVEGIIVQGDNKILFLNILRGPAALLVMWDHYTGCWPDRAAKEHWFISEMVRKYINTPLGIIQDFGFMGVMVFFLISGYLITHVAQREDRFEFIVKRFFRIYPPLFFSIILVAAFGFYKNVYYKAGDIFLAATLLNYFNIPQNPINGVAWSLVIEVLFYMLVVMFMTLIKKKAMLGSLLISMSCLIVIINSRRLGDNFFLFSVAMSYVPYLLMGQLLYYVENQRISFGKFALLTILNYYIIVKGIISINSNFYLSTNSYGVTFIYSYFIFIIAMISNKWLRENNMVTSLSYISKISYSLYLIHGTIGFFLLDFLMPRIGYSLAFLLTVSIVIFCSHWTYRLIEKPSQEFGIKFLKIVKKAYILLFPKKSILLEQYHPEDAS